MKTGAVGRIDQVLDLLRCPRCHGTLRRTERTVGCPAGHHFDLARQGYLNLAGRAAPPHADTAEMLAARARFLGAGAFDPVSEAVLDVLTDGLNARTPPRMLEVGAGTGHHVGRLLDEIEGRGLALDISPAAARRAASAHDRLGAVVADVWAPLPMPDAAVDAVLAIFAPRNPPEFARVLAPGGVVVVVTPQPDHLSELRELLGLLDIEPGKGDRLAAVMSDQLEPGPVREAHYRLDLDGAAVVDLVAMGPNAFHRERGAVAAQVQQLTLPLSTTVSVRVSGWRRR